MFESIIAIYDIYERTPDGTQGRWLREWRARLAGLNDGHVWVKNVSDQEAASSFVHECLHDKLDAPRSVPEDKAKAEEEILVDIAEEQWRIDHGLGAYYPRMPDPTNPKLEIPDVDKIRDSVERSPVYTPRSHDTIRKFRTRVIRGKEWVGHSVWKCSRSPCFYYRRVVDKLGYDPRHQPWGFGPKYKTIQ